MNLPRIDKQVQFTINANIPRQTAGKLLQIHEVVCIFRYYSRSALLLLRTPVSFCPCLAREPPLKAVEITRAVDRRGRNVVRLTKEVREIWPAAVPQNFRVICASSTQTVLLVRNLWESYAADGAKRRNNVETERTRKDG